MISDIPYFLSWLCLGLLRKTRVSVVKVNDENRLCCSQGDKVRLILSDLYVIQSFVFIHHHPHLFKLSHIQSGCA